MKSKTFLYNFSASSMGGGLKRLLAYAKWFNDNGGSNFIIHYKNESLKDIFPKNRYFPVQSSKYKRFLHDMYYLPDVIREIGVPSFYYSYGIPMYQSVADINWFHLSNVLPINEGDVSMSSLERTKFDILGRRIIRHLDKCDVISAESDFSLDLLHQEYHSDRGNFFKSVNGSDEEIKLFGQPREALEELAIIVGAGCNKRVEDGLKVFEALCTESPNLKLMIIGDKKFIPEYCVNDKRISVIGFLDREEVIKRLLKAKYYISTTSLENSYNAASEGIFIANESYISDIPPHQELLKGQPFTYTSVPGLNRRMLHIHGQAISPVNLKTWDNVIRDELAQLELVQLCHVNT